MVSFSPFPLYPRTKTTQIGGWVSLKAELDSVQRRKISCPFRDSKPVHSSHSVFAIPTELSQLKYLDIFYRRLLQIRPYWTFTNVSLRLILISPIIHTVWMMCICEMDWAFYTLVLYIVTTLSCRWRQYVPPKRWYPSMTLYGVITQTAATWIFSTEEISNLHLGSTQPLTEMSTKNLPGSKGRPARKANILTAICEPIV
jgi:hypothetical protein